MARTLRLNLAVSAMVASVALAACGGTATSPPKATPHTEFAPLEVRVVGGPDWMAIAFGSIWVKRDDGLLARLDPETGDVIAQVRTRVTSSDGCNGLGVSEDALWSCSGDDVVRVDPAQDDVVDTIAADKVFAQGRLVEAAGRIWVLSHGGEQLIGIGTTDGSVTDPISLPVACTDLGASGEILYAVCADTDTVLRIDLSSRSVTASVRVPKANLVSTTGDRVWVAGAEGVYGLDPTSLETRVRAPDVIPGYSGGILADESGVWVRRDDTFLTRLDASGAKTRVITGPYLGGDVVVTGDRIWTSDNENGVVVRLTVPTDR